MLLTNTFSPSISRLRSLFMISKNLQIKDVTDRATIFLPFTAPASVCWHLQPATTPISASVLGFWQDTDQGKRLVIDSRRLSGVSDTYRIRYLISPLTSSILPVFSTPVTKHSAFTTRRDLTSGLLSGTMILFSNSSSVSLISTVLHVRTGFFINSICIHRPPLIPIPFIPKDMPPSKNV